jgi:putative ABC transport system permease protein
VLLPRRAAVDLFDPASHDIAIDLAEARLRSPSRTWRVLLGVRQAVRVLLLYLDCWRIAVLHPAEYLLPDPRHVAPPEKDRMSMFFYYIRHAFRRLRREPAFTIAAVLTLALGVGANVAVFAVVEAVLLRPLPYAGADSLVILNNHDLKTGIRKQFIPIGDFIDIVERQKVFSSVAAYGFGQGTIFGEGDPYRVSTLNAAPGMLEMLRVTPALGRTFDAGDGMIGGPNTIMISYDLWQTRYNGDSAMLGRSIRVGTAPRTVVGVLPKGFHFPPNVTSTDIATPIKMVAQAPPQRKTGFTFAIARLKPGQTIASATADLDALSKQFEKEHPDQNAGSTHYAESLRDALVGSTKSALVLLLSAVGVVLLIACANVANLMLARSLSRRREMAVRLALGAGRSRVAAMLVTESLVLALIASLVGSVFAFWGARALVTLVPASINVPGLTDVRVNGAVFAFALGLAVLTALVFGTLATFSVRLEHTTDVLVSAGRATMTKLARRATAGLVVAEVALAVVLLVGAGLILRSFASLVGVDPGFRYDRVITMNVSMPAAAYPDSMARYALYQRIKAELGALPGVEAVGAAAVTPLTGNNWTVPFERPEHRVPPGERAPDVGWQAASGGFFTALQIPLRSGRYFDATDRPDTRPVVIISESMERRFFPGESAVGKTFLQGQGTAEIIGVVGDIRRAGLRDAPREDMYFPFERQPAVATTWFIRTAGEPSALLGAARSTLKSIEPNTMVASTPTMAEVASQSIRVTKLMLWLLAVFAGTALALAAVGIYGVMSYAVRQRSREIGTRMALGATSSDVVTMVMRQGGIIAALGTALGIAAGLVATRALQASLFGVKAHDPATLAIAAGVLIVTVLTACYVPARRAARTDPARTLMEQ